MKPKFNFINKRLSSIRKAHLYRSLLDSKISGPFITIKRKKLINLSSNDYLGLGNAKTTSTQLQSSSRLVAGNDILFKKLEDKLSRHKSQEASLVFPTGYMANLGIISILPQTDDLIISDDLNHASIIDSCRLSHAKKTIFKHNDITDLERKLRKKSRRKFVITEGIFSMNGDFAKLKEISNLCEIHNAILVLDDAHGDFVAGPDGKGSAANLGVANKVDVYISSLSKGLGAFGGYVSSRHKVIDLAINSSRPFIYTSALPNQMVKIALEKFSSNREQKRTRLWENVKQFRMGLESLGFIVESQSHIIPIIIGDEKKTLDFGRNLFREGVFAQPIRYPTVKFGSARIRISITAWLTKDIINNSVDIFEKVGKRFKVL